MAAEPGAGSSKRIRWHLSSVVVSAVCPQAAFFCTTLASGRPSLQYIIVFSASSCVKEDFVKNNKIHAAVSCFLVSKDSSTARDSL